MSALTPIFYLVTISINLILGFFVFFRNTKEKINRTFLALILSITGWIGSLYLFYTVDSSAILLWVGRFNFAIVITSLYYILRFPFIFPRETFKIPKRLATILRFWVVVFFLVTLFTPLIDKAEIIKGPAERETVYGLLYPLFIIHCLLFAGGGIFLIFQKIKAIKDRLERYQIIYFALGLSFALFFAFLTNLFLPLLGVQQAAYLGPLSTIVFSLFTAYAILKYYLFDIKVLATEFFVGAVGFILLVQGLAVPTPFLKIIDFTILFLFLIFGYSLIKSVINEISYRQKLQQAYNELKELDEAKSEFISIASHQLRTPLSAIKGYISMILEGDYGALPDRTKKPLDNVYESNERLIKLVNDLLNLSASKEEVIEIKKEPVSLEKTLADALEMFKKQAKEKGLYLKLEKPKQEVPEIMLDKEKLAQIIFNLVDNAIRYTNEGGITISINRDKSMIVISVKDTGEGIEQEDLKELFKSFSRGPAGGKYWTEGLGLGLYIAQKFVKLHQGSILVESAGKGRGSTFSIELPV